MLAGKQLQAKANGQYVKLTSSHTTEEGSTFVESTFTAVQGSLSEQCPSAVCHHS